MNPGKLIDARPLDADLRLGADYHPPVLETHFRFPRDRRQFSTSTLRCVGVGACRQLDHGTMCPSFMVTREEQHSTRGRARMLFEMLEGNPLDGPWHEDHVKERSGSLPRLQGLQEGLSRPPWTWRPTKQSFSRTTTKAGSVHDTPTPSDASTGGRSWKRRARDWSTSLAALQACGRWRSGPQGCRRSGPSLRSLRARSASGSMRVRSRRSATAAGFCSGRTPSRIISARTSPGPRCGCWSTRAST